MENEPRSEVKIELARPERLSLKLLFTTWTGGLILLHTIIFIMMTYESKSILLPSTEVLLKFGAKDPALIVSGQWWRLFTPMFVHIGIIHFFLNNLALFYVGQQMERLLKGRWFIVIYLLCGIGGGVGSGLFTVGISAGASGAIFGLFGVGFLFEKVFARLIRRESGKRLRQGPYTGLVVANLILGFMLSMGDTIGIDNAAHIGGLVSGICLAYAYLRLQENPLLLVQPVKGYAALVLIGGLFIVGGFIATRVSYIKKQINIAAHLTKNPARAYDFYSRGIAVDPSELSFYYERGKLLIFNQQLDEALADFEVVKGNPEYYKKLVYLCKELEAQGLNLESLQLQSYLGV